MIAGGIWPPFQFGVPPKSVYARRRSWVVFFKDRRARRPCSCKVEILSVVLSHASTSIPHLSIEHMKTHIAPSPTPSSAKKSSTVNRRLTTSSFTLFGANGLSALLRSRAAVKFRQPHSIMSLHVNLFRPISIRTSVFFAWKALLVWPVQALFLAFGNGTPQAFYIIYFI